MKKVKRQVSVMVHVIEDGTLMFSVTIPPEQRDRFYKDMLAGFKQFADMKIWDRKDFSPDMFIRKGRAKKVKVP